METVKAGWRARRIAVGTQDKVWAHRYHEQTHAREFIESEIRRMHGGAGRYEIAFTFRHVQCGLNRDDNLYLDVSLAMVDAPENRARLDALPQRLLVPELARLEKVGFARDV